MKLWGGRFQKDTNRQGEGFTASIHFDRRLYRYDILGSLAHCQMLGKRQIIGQDEADAWHDPLETFEAHQPQVVFATHDGALV